MPPGPGQRAMQVIRTPVAGTVTLNLPFVGCQLRAKKISSWSLAQTSSIQVARAEPLHAVPSAWESASSSQAWEALARNSFQPAQSQGWLPGAKSRPLPETDPLLTPGSPECSKTHACQIPQPTLRTPPLRALAPPTSNMQVLSLRLQISGLGTRVIQS